MTSLSMDTCKRNASERAMSYGGFDKTTQHAQAQRYSTLLICFAIAFPLVKEMLTNMIQSFVRTSFVFDLSFLYQPLVALVYLPLLVLIVRFVLSAIGVFPWREILPFVALFALVAFSAVLNAKDAETQSYYMNLFIGIATTAFPFYVLFRIAQPTKELLDAMGIAALVGVAAGFVVVNLFMSLTALSYSQWLSYLLLPCVVILEYKAFHGKRKRELALYGCAAALGFALLLSTGTRGPIVIAILYFLGSCLLPKRFSPAMRLGLALLLLLGGVFVFVNLSSIMSFLMGVLGELGVSVRLARLYSLNTLFVDDGRSSFAGLALDAIWNAPYGVGVGQDSVILAAAQDSTSIGGNYPHNIVLEIILQFGVVIGPVILGALVYLVWKAYKLGFDAGRSYLCIMLMLGVVPLLISGTYLEWNFFWAVLGACVSIISPIEAGHEEDATLATEA